MGIGRVSSWNCMSDMQMNPTGMTDTKSKSIQKEITDVQQKMQKLPSKEEYSPSEMADERKKLQKEISGLNIKLKLHQEKLLKSQKREAMLAKMQEEKELSPDKTEKEEASDREEQAKRQETVLTKNSDGTVILKEEKNPEGKGSVETEDEAKENIETDTKEDAGLSHKEMHAMVSANHSIQQADRQGVVIAPVSKEHNGHCQRSVSPELLLEVRQNFVWQPAGIGGRTHHHQVLLGKSQNLRPFSGPGKAPLLQRQIQPFRQRLRHGAYHLGRSAGSAVIHCPNCFQLHCSCPLSVFNRTFPKVPAGSSSRIHGGNTRVSIWQNPLASAARSPIPPDGAAPASADHTGKPGSCSPPVRSPALRRPLPAR